MLTSQPRSRTRHIRLIIETLCSITTTLDPHRAIPLETPAEIDGVLRTYFTSATFRHFVEQGIGGQIVFRIEITPPELNDPSFPTTLPAPSLPSFPRQESKPLSHPPLIPGGIRRPYPEEERENVPSDEQSWITVPI